MDETLSARLAVSGEQLTRTVERICGHGITADDVPTVARYCATLVEQCYYVASLAQSTLGKADARHPVKTAPNAVEIATALCHVTDLIDAAHTFAADSATKLQRIPN